MLSGVRRLIGAMRAYEKGGEITVDGIPTRLIMGDIRKTWDTSRIQSNMFTKISSSSLSFHKFFALDILYATERLLEEPRALTSPRTLNHFIKVLYEQTWLSSLKETHPDILNWSKLRNVNLTLMDSQKEFLESYNHFVPLLNLQGYYLAAPPGTGKTLTGLALAECLEADLVIVVSPPNAVHQVWKATIENNLRPDYPNWNSMDQGPVPRNCRHFIFHYHALEKALPILSGIRANKPIVIIDEGHHFNEISSQRTSLLINLCRTLKVEHVLWASGTPLKAIGYEAIPFLRTIDTFFTRDAEEGFRKIFGRQASRALDILANRLGYVMHKVDKADVVDNKKEEHEVLVKFPGCERFTLKSIGEEMALYIAERMRYYRENMKQYEEKYKKALEIHKSKLRSARDKEDYATYGRYITAIRRNYDPTVMKEETIFCNRYELKTIMPNLPDSMRKEFKNVRSVIKYVALKVRGECLGRILGKRRSECHAKMVEHSTLPEIIEGSIKKTLIFTSFVEVVEKTEEYLRDQGFKPLVVYAKTNKDLKSIIARFENDIDANPLIATYDSLSTAVPLTMANTVVLLNNPFRSHEREQTISRVDRKGQDTQVFVYSTLLDTGTEPNISTRSRDIMEWSREQVDAMLGFDSKKADIANMECYEDLLPEHVTDEYKVSVGILPKSSMF